MAIAGKAGVAAGILDHHDTARGDGVAAEGLLALDFVGAQPIAGFVPLPVGIDHRNQRDRQVEDVAHQPRNALERLLARAVQRIERQQGVEPQLLGRVAGLERSRVHGSSIGSAGFSLVY